MTSSKDNWLSIACQEGQQGIVRHLLNHGWNWYTTVGEFSWNMLMLWWGSGSYGLVYDLIDYYIRCSHQFADGFRTNHLWGYRHLQEMITHHFGLVGS